MTITSVTSPHHYHTRTTTPHTINILETVVRGRDIPGYEVVDTGVFVDWDELTAPNGHLSTTEIAACGIASAISVLEWLGAPKPPIATAIRNAIDAVIA